jgi:hypothetical protein
MPLRPPRPVLVAAYALGVLAVGMWADVATTGRTHLLRDVLSTGVVLVFGAIAGDVALTLIEQLHARLVGSVAISIAAVLIGHLLTPLMAMLVQIPRAGFEIVPTIVFGLEFVIRQAIVPSLVTGTLLGLIVSAATSHRQSEIANRESHHHA